MKHSEIRSHIIVTASELFYKNGYNRTGINEIIAESGVAKATLYNHFKSKEAICISYLQYKNAIFLEDILAYCQKKKQGKDQILGIFDFLLKFFKDSDFNGCWCIKTIAEIPKENENIRSEIQQHKNDFLTIISNLVGENLKISDKKKVQSMSRRIYLLYEGAVAESHLHQKNWPIVEARALCSQLIA